MIITAKNAVILPTLPFASRRGGVCRRRAAFLTERPGARRMLVSAAHARILTARRELAMRAAAPIGVRIRAARGALTYAPRRMTPFREACRNAGALVAVLLALWGALHLI